MITRLSFLECFSKHGYFTMHRLVWSKELLNYIAPFICHFGKTERECIVVVIAHPMEVTVLQKVKPDIGFFEVACWRWYISSEVLKIWKALIMQSWKFSCKSWQLSSAYLHSAEICWEYLCIHVLCVPEDFRTQLFAFKCICKCSVNFLNLTLYTCTCKFSSIEERWKGWGWGGETRTVQRKKLEQSHLDFCIMNWVHWVNEPLIMPFLQQLILHLSDWCKKKNKFIYVSVVTASIIVYSVFNIC